MGVVRVVVVSCYWGLWGAGIEGKVGGAFWWW